MGIFSFINYDKNGPGVSKDAPQKKRFFLFFELFFRKFKYMVGLNVIYLLLCIPIITIGPATAAITYVFRSFSREEPIFVFNEFWRIFKENFKYGVIVGIVDLILKAALGYSLYFYFVNINQSTFVYIPFILCMAALFMELFTGYYIYMLMVTVNLKLKGLVKNAFMLAMISMKSNIFTLIFSFIVVAPMVLMFPYSIPVIIILGASVPLFIQCFNAYPTIKKYCIDPVLEKEREEKASRGSLDGPDELDEVIFQDTVGNEEKKQH
ncbi:MAG: YesL family protein [Oscillospiraceae bacterium]|nr:YesL family protein [Oscillospiraceae bacterium]